MQQSAASAQSRIGFDRLEAEVRFSLSPIIAAAAMIFVARQTELDKIG